MPREQRALVEPASGEQPTSPVTGADPGRARAELQQAMSEGAGVLRSAESLTAAADRLRALGSGGGGVGTAAWELANLTTVATALVAAAYSRQETRGCHWRSDWPEPAERWRAHLHGAVTAEGSFSLAWERA